MWRIEFLSKNERAVENLRRRNSLHQRLSPIGEATERQLNDKQSQWLPFIGYSGAVCISLLQSVTMIVCCMAGPVCLKRELVGMLSSPFRD